jgi:hypothetical protein
MCENIYEKKALCKFTYLHHTEKVQDYYQVPPANTASGQCPQQ